MSSESSKKLRVEVSLLVLLLSVGWWRPAGAAVVVAEVARVAQHTSIMLQEYANEVRMEALSQRWAAGVREKVSVAIDQFTGFSREIDAELTRLGTNPERNAELLEKMREAKERAEHAKERLKTLNGLMNDYRQLKTAKKSGFLERTFREVAAAVEGAGKEITDTHEELGEVSLGDWRPGFVEVRSIEILEGDMTFHAARSVAGFEGLTETELSVGERFPANELPIRIRVCIEDSEKKRLRSMKQQGIIGESIHFLETDGTPGHKYAYEGAPGVTTWTAKERYKFTTDSTVEENARIRAYGQRNSDGSTERSSGDILEIHTTSPIAQNLTFDVEGEVIHWERVRKHHREMRGNVPTEDGTARARIVLSLFPR